MPHGSVQVSAGTCRAAGLLPSSVGPDWLARPPARSIGAPAAIVILSLAGCATADRTVSALEQIELRDRATDYLARAVGYPYNPVVRVEAIEALQSRDDPDALPWIRAALLDEHPAVRFAACVALGVRRDRSAESGVRNCLADEDASVRVAALFALHQLGDKRGTGKLATYLLEHEDPTVRRNAALVFGLMGEPGAVKILAKAMKDRDRGVRQHALEAMARLGNEEAAQELVFMTNTGVGSEEVFAINALAAIGDPQYEETFRYKLVNAPHLETKLAAARGLGLLGSDIGFEVAEQALEGGGTVSFDPNDPPEGQRLRRVQLAAAALGAIGRAEALPRLQRTLEDSPDPRIQVSAARAVVEIVASDAAEALPFGERAAAGTG